MEISCVICFDNLLIDETESIYSTKCGHVFHYECILQWTESSSSCPNCRQDVTVDTLIKLNLPVSIEKPSITRKRITRSSTKNSSRGHLLQSELQLKNPQLDSKVKGLEMKNGQFQLMEKELQLLEKKYRTSETENDRLRLEIGMLQKDISKLQNQLQSEKERNVIIRSDLRIMDIIDLVQQ